MPSTDPEAIRRIREGDFMARLSETNAEQIKESMKAAGINFVVYVPDSWSHLLLKKIIEDKSFTSVGMVREDEGMATAMGAFMGGKNSAIIMEASGMGLSGLALGWLGALQRMALLIISSHTHVFGEREDYHAPARIVSLPIMNALNIPSIILQDIKDSRRIFKQAQMTIKGQLTPVCISLPRHILWEEDE
jgi:sulfopyruvate decarboxylase TPP-binding subunit